MSQTNKTTDAIRAYLDSDADMIRGLDAEKLTAAAELILDAQKSGATVFTAGDPAVSGQMADSLLHGCAVLGRAGIKSVRIDSKETLEALGKRGDVLVILPKAGSACCGKGSCAADYARSIGMKVIGILPADGGAAADKCDIAICTGTECPAKTADLQLAGIHAITSSLRAELKDAWGMEVVFPPVAGRKFKFALFDFDGTLSLIREGWQKIMIPYFCEEVAKTPGGQTADPEEIRACVTEFVDMLTGKQTIYQCMALADEVKKRGGTPLEPIEYKNEYLRRLMEKIKDRREGLANGSIDPETLLVRGSVALVKALKDAGIVLYLASGTDQPQVREEAHLLGMDKYFGENIYGALDEHITDCTKELVIKRLLSENGVSGTELLSFGDGFVEIELVSKIGGYPIAVATDEARKMGIDEWKRERLVKAGAGAVIPDFECADKIVDFIMGR